MADNSRPRRRWFQFRLRTLLVLIAVVALPLAWIARERRQSRYEAEVAETLQRRDFLDVALAGPYDSLERAARDEPQGWRRDLARRVFGERIVVVWIANETFDDLTPLARLTSLKRFNVHGAPVVDLAPLAGLHELTYLDLGSTAASDLTPLARLANLEWLGLGFTKVTDVAPLAGLQKLKSLSLDSTPVADVAPLAELKKLESLNLRATQVKDVAALKQCKNLKKLSLDLTPVTQEQGVELQKALPNCAISLGGVRLQRPGP
ncbi:MAG TPA: hypothetical protein VGJ26_05655 [Pirellulales bacterium]|jgi:hypothetical protein